MLTLSSLEYDTLKEITSIGGGNASQALSQMIGSPVSIAIPELKIIPIKEASALIGSAERVMTIVLVKIVGDIPGTMLFVYEPNDAIKLASLLNNKPNSSVLDENDRSALKEISNILSGASLNALSNFLKLTLLQSIPEITTDMVITVIDNIIAQFGDHSEEILMLQLILTVPEKSISIKIDFLLDPNSTSSIISATKDKIT